MPTPPAPVVLIQGFRIHSSSWRNWIELLEEAGHGPVATAWPGATGTVEATRAPDQPVSTADETVAQALEDVALTALAGSVAADDRARAGLNGRSKG